MMQITAASVEKQIGLEEIISGELDGERVELHGAVYALRELGGISFLSLRMADGVLQCVCPPELLPRELGEECTLRVTGLVRRERRAPGGRELAAEGVELLTRPELRRKRRSG